MKIKDNPNLLAELASVCNPIEFIKSIMTLQEQTGEDVAKAANMSIPHFYITLGRIKTDGVGITPELCVRLANALDIDPVILHRVICDYRIKCYLAKQQNTK